MDRDSSTSLAPGFRFHPTDEELVRFYLKRKVTGKPFRVDPIALVDVYKFEPWDLPCMSKLKSRDLEWYFFSVLDRKYGNGSRTNRATEKGYWKTTGKDRPIKQGERTIGMKKTLVYHMGRAPRGNRTNWVMHEYKLVDEELAQAGVVQDAFVLCRIFEKSGTGPKNGEKYGAPFIEEEWEDDDVVAAVPLANVQLPNEASPGDAGGFIETDDLYQKLDTSVTIASAGLPSNFYEGECSSYPEHSQQLIDNQKPLGIACEISGPQNDQPFDVGDSEKYGVHTSLVKDEENGKLSHSENPLSFGPTFDDLDLYLDTTGYAPFDYLPIDDDGSFLETNDLVKPDLGTPTDADPSATDMLDEYLTYPDDDITKYISFDSPHDTGSENYILNQGSPPIQQIVEGDTEDAFQAETKNASLENKPDIEVPSKAASSDQNPHPSKSVSDGNTDPFVKHANKWLASIPAPPAFASEFPTKGIALGLHHAAQSSNSAHVTAGMISITNISLRGNEMDWVMGKNGGFNTIVSAGFSQPDVNSAASLVPVSGLLSGKTAFVLSHGWIFLLSFSVLILSLSFKIGTYMYTSK